MTSKKEKSSSKGPHEVGEWYLCTPTLAYMYPVNCKLCLISWLIGQLSTSWQILGLWLCKNYLLVVFLACTINHIVSWKIKPWFSWRNWFVNFWFSPLLFFCNEKKTYIRNLQSSFSAKGANNCKSISPVSNWNI